MDERRMDGLRLLFAMTLASLPIYSADAEEDGWPRERQYQGPMTFCDPYFAIELGENDSTTVSDPGLDFLLTYLNLGDWSVGVYEGNHPQQATKRKPVKTAHNLEVERLEGENAQVSYLVNVTPDASLPVFLHIFGERFAGNEGDLAFLMRFRIGTPSQTGCGTPTYHP
jgi:hypothetical protein